MSASASESGAAAATRDAREITIDLPYMSLAAKDWPGSDVAGASVTPILALHGWLDNAASFDRLAQLLPVDRRMVALDLPGHGLSDHRPAGVYTYFLDYVPVIFDVADALGWERFVLLGHSMGAGIGVLAAGTLPERIPQLILIDGMGPLTEEDAGAPARFRSFLQARAATETKSVRSPTANAASPAANSGGGSVYPGVEQAVRARRLVGGISDASARLLVERNLTQRLTTDGAPDGFIWRTDARLKLPSPLRMTESQVRAFLKQIAAPTLLIGATDSEFAAYENLIQARASQIPELTTRKLTGGHHLHMENPEPVAAAIAEFLG